MPKPTHWPKEEASAKRDHLHAVGVIAHSFSTLEEGMLGLFQHHFAQLKVPYPLIERLYLPLNENQKLEAIGETFEQCEKDKKVKALVQNMIEYFHWCSDTRNKIIHAEPYPALFGLKQEMLHLSKRMSRRDSKRGYLQLELSTLRELADGISEGVRHCAGIRIWLRLRDTPPSSWSISLKAMNPMELPQPLTIPDKLKLADTPSDEVPKYLRQRKTPR